MGYIDKNKKREYQRVWMANRREAFFCDKTCKHCGDDEDLQLHHLDPSKKESHSIWGWSKKRQLVEIAKCIVLCRGCHMKVHGKRLGRTCGKVSTYKYGCRCEKCTVVGSAHNKARKLRYKQERMDRLASR